jgi:uncharacterized membrane protein
MQLLFLFLLIVLPYAILTLVSRWPRLDLPATARGRVSLSLFFSFTAIGHFIRTKEMAAMLPPSFPYAVETIYLTGVLELLGAVGVWIPRLMKLTGICLILMLLTILPANIYSAINHVEFGGHAVGPVYLFFRVPFQLFLICWTYFATEQKWFRQYAKND